MALDFLMVGLGGFLGSCARFALTKASNHFTAPIPLGTLISNIIAGFFVGAVLGSVWQPSAINPRARLFLTTGLMGGLSTFSTFSYETAVLFQGGKYLPAAGNIALNLLLSLTAVLAGMYCAKIIV